MALMPVSLPLSQSCSIMCPTKPGKYSWAFCIGVLFTLIACKMQSNSNSQRIIECVIRFGGINKPSCPIKTNEHQLDVNRFIILPMCAIEIYMCIYVRVCIYYLYGVYKRNENSQNLMYQFDCARSLFLIASWGNLTKMGVRESGAFATGR